MGDVETRKTLCKHNQGWKQHARTRSPTHQVADSPADEHIARRQMR